MRSSTPSTSVTRVIEKPLFVHRLDVAHPNDSHPGHELRPNDDRAAIAAWLNEYKNKPETLRSYSREAGRFFLWMAESKLTLAKLGRSHLDQYCLHLQNPPAHWLPAPTPNAPDPLQEPTESQQQSPPADSAPTTLQLTLSLGLQRTPRTNHGQGHIWTPLRAPFDRAACRHTLVILQSMLEWLRDAEYTTRNPAKLIRDKGPKRERKSRPDPTEKSLRASLHFLISHASVPDLTVRDADRAQRRQSAFMWSWIYFTACRRQEVAGTTLGSITPLVRETGSVVWILRVLGKGEKPAQIPLDDAAVALLSWYLNKTPETLADHIRAHPKRPLLKRMGVYDKNYPNLSSAHVYEAIVRGAEIIRASHASLDVHPEHHRLLSEVRPHDLRAYRNTHLLGAGVDPRFVQRLMRHTDFNTTLIYDHTADIEFQDAIRWSSAKPS